VLGVSVNEKEKREQAWRELELSRQGIFTYDELLFRIRSWSIALTGILVGGYLGINVDSNKGISPGIAISAIILTISMFWILDGLNKSLQMVHIFNSRDIEDYLRGDELLYFGPNISLRFEKKMGRHIRPTIKNLLDESIWPFYLFPIIMTCTVIYLYSLRNCRSFGGIGCQISNDWWFPIISIFFVFFLSFLSYSYNNKSIYRHVGFKLKQKKQDFIKELSEKIKRDDEELYNIIWKERFFGPYKANAYHSDFVLFVDGRQRVSDRNYDKYVKKRSGSFARNNIRVIYITLDYDLSSSPVTLTGDKIINSKYLKITNIMDSFVKNHKVNIVTQAQ
jgi:hypothetical protein